MRRRGGCKVRFFLWERVRLRWRCVDRVHIHCCGNGYLGFRPDGGSLLKSPGAGPVKSKQNALAPPLGASPRLGMPERRHCSVGPPRRAIHGPECVKTSAKNRGARSCVSSGKSRQAFRPGIHGGTRFLGRFLITLTVVRVLTHSGPSAATSASMPRCPRINACVRPSWLTGRRNQRPPRGGLVADLVLLVVHPSNLFEQDLWEQSLLAKAAAHPTLMQADPLLSRASSLPHWIFIQ
jgi:hypothetical protein